MLNRLSINNIKRLCKALGPGLANIFISNDNFVYLWLISETDNFLVIAINKL